jgi:hypothetical protein
VQVASVSLRLPIYCAVNYSLSGINLWALRRYVRQFQPDNVERSRSSGLRAAVHCAYETAPLSIFDNHKWRDPHLAPVGLFIYMLVGTKDIHHAIADDVDLVSLPANISLLSPSIQYNALRVGLQSTRLCINSGLLPKSRLCFQAHRLHVATHV